MKLVELYQSTGADELFVKLPLTTTIADGETRILIDSTNTFQEIDGFGASFTDASAYLIDQVLADDVKKELMTNLFSPTMGIGLSVIRNPMGASDYAREIYSYDDQLEGKTDPELIDFSIEHDRVSILPLTKWAMELNPDLKLFASPWSPPAWMKTSGTMKGGKLLPEFYESYANYFVKFIQAYGAEDIAVYAVTPQNEPLFEPLHYPSMEFLATEAGKFIKENLRPAFERNQITTKILGYDHNWDRIDYAYDIIDYVGAAVDGIAWHWYGGRPVSQSRVHDHFPQIETHFTEGSGGEWIPAFEPAFSNVIRTGIEIMRHHSKSFILWNLALDEKNGPTVPGFGQSTCRGLVEINQQNQGLTYTLDYYALAHFSKFVMTGAKRIGTNQTDALKNVAFLNQDGSIVTVIFNDSLARETFSLEIDDQRVVALEIPSKGVLTLVAK